MISVVVSVTNCIVITIIIIRLCAGSIGAGQLAQLFQNLGNPLPYDRLVKIMSDYDVDKKGARRAPVACCAAAVPPPPSCPHP